METNAGRNLWSHPSGHQLWGRTPWHEGRLSQHTPIPSRTDVVIVGGGLTGCSAAYHLARLGIRAAVLEADLVASGASGRTGGLVLEGTAAGPMDRADDCVPRLAGLVERERIRCDLQLPGVWEIGHSAGEKGAALPWTDEGKPVAISARVAGGTVEPALLNLGLAEAAIKAGASIFEQVRVSGIDLDSHLRVEYPGGTIRTDWVVVAANAWIRTLLPEIPIASSLTFACATEVLDESVIAELGLEKRIPFYTVDLPYLWGRITDEGRAVFGSGLLFGPPDALEDTGPRTPSFVEEIEDLKFRIGTIHPAFLSVGIPYSWAGPIAFTRNQVPILCPVPGATRVLVAGAYSGHGVAMSVRAGQMLALAISKDVPLPDWGSLSRH